MCVNKVYLIRHGETDFNRARRLQGHLPTPLNSNGILQAEALGLYLKHQQIDAIFSSTLPRARQTADIIGRSLNLIVHDEPRLGEIAFGKFEGLTFSEIKEAYTDAYRMWHSGDMSYEVPGGESRRSVQLRMTEAWEALISRGDEAIALVTHGGSMKILLSYLFYRLPSKTVGNTSMTVLSRFDAVWEIETYAATPHLND